MFANYKDFVIEVFNDETYVAGSADNINNYANEYINNDHRGNLYGIKVFQDESEISSAIISESGGGTAIHQRSFMLKNDALFICCGCVIFSLSTPELKLNWAKKCDMATCFSIYEFDNDFITHGELEITRLTETGMIKWQFSARDIFVNLQGKKPFEIIGDKIKLVDFLDYEYILDANGKLIDN